LVRPTPFEITEQTEGQASVLSLSGELDLGTVTALSRQIDATLDKKPSTLTVNLTELTFMDSSGLRLLIELYDRSRREAWTLKLIASRDSRAMAVLRLTGAASVLPFESPSG
jgi:anti-anti-sigma factor